ncbi:hypothetical protein TcasGA2_TC000421 [Tribolium castaneum]|uniref:Uncharacterized protein n=1 Tax=Tribolium castaneum TaxID=7070 RepID=D6WAD9_TRICA|nr:hypothetical protein TcasGA2_TC000421 [Tribolium castaneum]
MSEFNLSILPDSYNVKGLRLIEMNFQSRYVWMVLINSSGTALTAGVGQDHTMQNDHRRLFVFAPINIIRQQLLNLGFADLRLCHGFCAQRARRTASSDNEAENVTSLLLDSRGEFATLVLWDPLKKLNNSQTGCIRVNRQVPSSVCRSNKTPASVRCIRTSIIERIHKLRISGNKVQSEKSGDWEIFTAARGAYPFPVGHSGRVGAIRGPLRAPHISPLSQKLSLAPPSQQTRTHVPHADSFTYCSLETSVNRSFLLDPEKYRDKQ